MALFEHIFMLRQDLSTTDLESAISNHEQTIGELKGTIVYKESWGLKNLSYPIKKNKKAFYQYMNIEIPNERITEMNSKLNLNEDIIRHLSIKVKKFEETPSPMIKEKE
tara:strand:- start:1146 stop:1472 length:327 start_codon:yes stop_codon:yes gene_type:complete